MHPQSVLRSMTSMVPPSDLGRFISGLASIKVGCEEYSDNKLYGALGSELLWFKLEGGACLSLHH